MRRLVCACVVSKPPKTGFLTARSILLWKKKKERDRLVTVAFQGPLTTCLINIAWLKAEKSNIYAPISSTWPSTQIAMFKALGGKVILR